jgi:hypothetical protein
MRERIITVSGATKHISMLKRAGLVQCTGFQTYTVTEKAKALMQVAN